MKHMICGMAVVLLGLNAFSSEQNLYAQQINKATPVNQLCRSALERSDNRIGYTCPYGHASDGSGMCNSSGCPFQKKK